jgi:acetoin utilization protein AcuC
MPIAILYRDELNEYDFGPGHPFRGDRYNMFIEFLKEHVAEDDNYCIIESKLASDEDLLFICTQDYIDRVQEFYKAAHVGLIDTNRIRGYLSGDNIPYRSPGEIEKAARVIIGQAKLACSLIQENKFQKAVSIGGGMHHAKPSFGEGFCIYNDVAFCGKYLIEHYKLERVLILDTDAHAGNGTMEFFYEEPRVLFVDLHQDPSMLDPGTGFAHQIGAGKGKGFTVNVPMPIRAGYDSYQLVFESIVEPLVQEFKPQIIVRNGGSDPHYDDHLTQLGLPLEGFRMIGEKVRALAKICDGKVIDLIASGYNKEVLPYAWLELISGLAGFKYVSDAPEERYPQIAHDSAYDETKEVIEEVKHNLKDYWKL